MKKIKLFELFAGYGGASFALKKAGVEHETVGYSEIDKFAIKCYEQNNCIETDFNTEDGWKREKLPKNFGDVTKIDSNKIPDFDLLTGGFPCQAFSIAGKGLGEQDVRGTLFHEIIRIAEVKKPKYMLLENVKGLTTKKHKETFEKILSELERIGYFVRWHILNSKDYGIPQNRERVWFVCFRDKNDYFNFDFPKKEELNIFLKDILEEEVDDKYYLSEKNLRHLLIDFGSADKMLDKNGISNTLTQSMGSGSGNVSCILPNQEISYCVDANYHKGTNLKGFIEKKRRQLVQVKNATKKGYQEAYIGDGINLEQPNSKTRRGRLQKQISSTLQTNDQRGVLLNNLRIRKLTPKECFRLQGFINDEINLDGLSNTQKYKLASNGWDINVVSKMFENIFK